MNNVVTYTEFFWLRELHKHIKQFEKEDNQECVNKLKKTLKNNLTKLQKCAKTSKSIPAFD